MIEKLIKEKQAKLAEYDAMKKVLDVEKRSAFNNDERDKANALKIELENINEQIKIEESMIDAKRSLNDKKVEVNVPINVKEDHTAIVKETDNALRSFMLGKSVDSKYLDNGKFQLSADYQTIKRATITTSTNSGPFVQTTTLDQVSVTSPELVLQKAGAQKLVFEANKGDVKAPSMTGLRGVFVSEGSSTSELALASASATLRPTLLIVPLKVSKAFIATQSAANFAGLIQDMFAGIDRGLEYKAFQQLSGITAMSVASGTSFYATACNMEANVIGAGSAYIFSRTGTSRAKQKYIGTSGTETVWKNDVVNGYPAYRASILSDVAANDGYYGNFKDIALATFGPISLEIVTDATLALAGEVLLTVSVMADSKVITSNSFARVSNVHQLS